MHFDYAQYLRGCLLVPLSILLLALPMLISSVWRTLIMITAHKFSTRDGMNLLLIILVSGFFICMNWGRLSHGGIHLIQERESDAVVLHGEIQDIHELDRYSFPEFRNEYGHNETNGVQILVDGVRCTAITRGTLKLGDVVTVVYLPRSGYVLSIALDKLT